MLGPETAAFGLGRNQRNNGWCRSAGIGTEWECEVQPGGKRARFVDILRKEHLYN